MQDYYETLQVHPKADAEAIRAAYERLRQRYNPTLLEGAADELIELARTRRDEIERAYIVLSDAERRAHFDSEFAFHQAGPAVVEEAAPAQRASPVLGDDDLIDYRPLPPAHRQERAKTFNAQPYLAAGQVRRSSAHAAQPATVFPNWIVPALLLTTATFAIVLVTLITTINETPAATTTQASQPNILDAPAEVQPTATTDQIINQFEQQIAAARLITEQTPQNPNAWIELGHMLYDSTVVVRERLGSGDQSMQGVYIERLPRWLEAADAYRQALNILPADALTRADLAMSLCYYGSDMNDQSYVQDGLTEAAQAVADAPDVGRPLLSLGLCQVSANPPQVQQALEQWQKVIVLSDVEPAVALQARQLITQYSQ